MLPDHENKYNTVLRNLFLGGLSLETNDGFEHKGIRDKVKQFLPLRQILLHQIKRKYSIALQLNKSKEKCF